jgi:predicted PurR-regulated permease PerM
MNICRVPTSSVYARLLPPLLTLALTLGLLYFGQIILKPLALSALIGLLLTSPCRFFERQGFPRAYAALIVLLFSMVIFVVIFYFLFNSIFSFREDLPQMKQNIDSSLQQLEQLLGRWLHISTIRMHEIVQSSSTNLLPKTSYIVNKTLTLGSVILFAGIMLLIMTFLMLLYRGLIVAFFLRLFHDEHAAVIQNIFNNIQYVIRGYIAGLLTEMIILAVAYSTTLALLGIRYALLLGVIGALINILPYVGIIITCVLTALISITTNTPLTVLWAVICLIVIHMIDVNILNPVIIGNKVRINALANITAVITMAALWGLPGTFMALPLLAIVKVIFEEIPAFQSFAILMGDDNPPVPKGGALIGLMTRRIRFKTKK